MEKIICAENLVSCRCLITKKHEEITKAKFKFAIKIHGHNLLTLVTMLKKNQVRILLNLIQM